MKDNLKIELRLLMAGFLKSIDDFNMAKKHPNHNSFFEDDIEPTIKSFIKWLNWD